MYIISKHAVVVVEVEFTNTLKPKSATMDVRAAGPLCPRVVVMPPMFLAIYNAQILNLCSVTV